MSKVGEPVNKSILIRTAIAGTIIGVLIGYSLRAITESDRFLIKEAGEPGLMYKVDTRTGKTWVLYRNIERPVEPP